MLYLYIYLQGVSNDGIRIYQYSTKNQSYANAIKECLERERICTWMAPGDIPPGSRYAEIITKALKDCSCLVLILSNDSQKSRWVGNEVERALNYGKPVIPVKIEEVTLNDEFDFYIGASQIVALNKIDLALPEVREFLKSVGALAGRQEKPISSIDSAASAQKSKENERDRVSSGGSAAGKTPTRDPENKRRSPVSTAELVAAECRDFLNGLDPAFQQTLTNGMNNPVLQQSLGIPSEAKIFFAHDDTVFGNGKNGFAVWENGISVKAIWEPKDFIDWQMFAENGAAISEEKNSGYALHFRPANKILNRRIMYITGGNAACISQLLRFYIHLQEELRKI